VDLDRQSIERRDFPIARRGYTPAAVDAHLRALAADVEELRRSAEADRGGGAESLGSAAATQVQSILEAAEAAAADIERQAAEDARRMRADAGLDAERTRTEAVQRSRAHVEAVTQATAVLLAQVQSMDGEVSALLQSLHAGASRLAADLGSVETNMGELYDAASGRGSETAGHDLGVASALGGAPPPEVASPTLAPRPPVLAPPVVEPEPTAPEPAPPVAPRSAPAPAQAAPRPASPPAIQANGGGQAAGGGGDVDGARLVALNMALNGESREQADRYLADNFQLADRAKLLDEVYAAIEV
jgi:hypothetical protein